MFTEFMTGIKIKLDKMEAYCLCRDNNCF